MADEEVISRYTRTSPLMVFLGAALSAFIVWWAAAGHAQYHAGTMLIIGAVCLGYFLWRFGTQLNALVLHNGRAIYLHGVVIHGLSKKDVRVPDITGIELRINEAGRAVLSVKLHSGEVVRTPVSGMEPSPQEIETRLSALIVRDRAS